MMGGLKAWWREQWLVVAAIVGSSACVGVAYAIVNQPDWFVELCVERIKVDLRSPSTFELLEVQGLTHVGEHYVWIVYDSANAFGTPIRGHGLCRTERHRSITNIANIEFYGHTPQEIAEQTRAAAQRERQ